MSGATKSFLYPDSVGERSTPTYRATWMSNGLPVQAGSVSSILFWLRDVRTGAIVNGRDGVDVFNVNGGALVNGVFTLQLSSEDTQHYGDGKAEKRLMTFDVLLQSGGRLTREVSFYVRSFQDVPSAGSPGGSPP
jgi:hypothetical protein